MDRYHELVKRHLPDVAKLMRETINRSYPADSKERTAYLLKHNEVKVER